jgi:hypothetical protein
MLRRYLMTFFEIITAAIADIEKYGYDSQARLDGWLHQIVEAAKATMTTQSILENELRRALTSTYERTIKGEKLLKVHPGISRFKLEMVKPKLHAELQRRLLSSSQLIRLNREDMLTRTKQRFSGWATSIPVGGSKVTDTNEVKENVSKALKSLPFNERRVMIDQTHKFVSDLNNIVAIEGGAIGAKWCSHYRQPGYNFRPDHAIRNDKIYAIRGSWAISQGLINKGAGYTDDMTMPGEEVYCRCQYVYIYALRNLPDDMLTQKGREALEIAKQVIKKAQGMVHA